MFYNISTVLKKYNKIPRNRAFHRNKHVVKAEREILKYQHEYELIDSRVKKDFLHFLETKTDAYRMVLRALLILTNFGKKLSWFSQNSIAKEAGVSVSSVGRMIGEFISDGLLIKAKPKWRTDTLRLSDIFKASWMKRRLKAFFGLILCLPVSALFSFSKERCLSEYERLLKEEKNIYLRDLHGIKKKKRKRQKFEAKKRKSCSMEISDEHMGLISQVKFVKLTQRGITELVKFSVEALRFALDQTPYISKHTKNKFAWFCKQCWDYTKAHGEQLNRVLYDKCKYAAIRNGTWSELTHEEPVMKKIKKEEEYDPYKDEAWRLDLDPFEELLKAKESGKLNPTGLAFLESCGIIPKPRTVDKMSTVPVVDKLETTRRERVSTTETRSELTKTSQEICYTNEFDEEEDNGFDPSLDPFGDKDVQ